MKNKYYCFHAHFDLPPREDPWLGLPEPDPAAAPYSDALEQSLHTCFGPNASSPLLDEDGRILEFRNNFLGIGFDFNPEILDWIERRRPRVYRRILEADRESAAQHDGHGNALASPYPPLLLPLASPPDRRTAVRWGLSDFERRFGRKAEGMCLPENALDEETLELLAEYGLRFTLADPVQAAAARPAGSTSEEDWFDVSPESFPTTRPYLWRSRRSGRSLAIFFTRRDLDPERLYARLPFVISAGQPLKAAREQVLDVGQRFANRMIDSFSANDALELSHVAVDGMLFGRKRLHGNRALTFALETLAREAPAAGVNHAQYLELFPPPEEIRLHRESSRRGEGLEHWRSGWRKSMREALDWLSGELGTRFSSSGTVFRDPARARESYGSLLFETRAEPTQPFLDAEAAKHPSPQEAQAALRLCEGERYRLRMLSHWTGAGGDPADPEPVQSLRFAGRAIDLLGEGGGVEREFIKRLSRCPSLGTPYANAADIYTRLAGQSGVGLKSDPADPASALRAAAHFAVADQLDNGPLPSAESADEPAPFDAEVFPFCRRTRRIQRRMHSFSAAFVSIRRRKTFERIEGAAAVLHSGETDLECWVSNVPRERAIELAAEIEEIFLHRPLEVFHREADRLFGAGSYRLDALFPASRRRAAQRLLPRGGSDRREFLASWHALMRRFRDDEALAVPVAERLIEAAALGLPIDALPGVPRLRARVLAAAEAFADSPSEETLDHWTRLLSAAGKAGLHLNLWELQSLAWEGIGKDGARLKPGTTGAKLVRWLADTLGISEALLLPSPAVEA